MITSIVFVAFYLCSGIAISQNEPSSGSPGTFIIEKYVVDKDTF